MSKQNKTPKVVKKVTTKKGASPAKKTQVEKEVSTEKKYVKVTAENSELEKVGSPTHSGKVFQVVRENEVEYFTVSGAFRKEHAEVVEKP